jgi:hypothetical protein
VADNKTSLDDDSDRIAATGEWWVNPWWESAEPNFLFPVSIERVRYGAAILRNYFDADWYKRLAAEPRENIVFPYLCLLRASWALSFIAGFGERLEKLAQAEGLTRPLRALRERDGKSAFLELEVAEGFAETGYTVSFPKEGGSKSYDVLVIRDAIQIAIECKRLGTAAWERWEDRLMSDLSFGLRRSLANRELAINVFLNPGLSQVSVGQDSASALNDALHSALRDEIFGQVEAALASSNVPQRLLVAEIAEINIEWATEESRGGVTGMEYSASGVFRRIFQNAILPATAQLPESIPGVIVIYSRVAPPAQFFRLLFDAACKADAQRFSRVAAVVICTLQTVFEWTAPTLYVNRFTKYPDVVPNISDTFIKTFQVHLG